MFCRECGKQLKDASKFCQYCGTTQDVTETGLSQPPVSGAHTNNLENAGIPEATASGSKANYEEQLKKELEDIKLWNKGCIVGAAVILVWLLLYFTFGRIIISAWFLLLGLLFPVSVYFRFDTQNKINQLRKTISKL